MKITESDLESLIDEPFLERGHRYFRDGVVEVLESGELSASGCVSGNKDYRVTLRLNKGDLNGHCTCPAYSDIGPCKHMAALGYALIAIRNPETGEIKKKSRTIMERIGEYLDAQPAEALRTLLLQEAARDKQFRKRLELLSKIDKAEVDTSALRKALRQAIGNGKYVDYYEAAGWVEGIETVVSSIARLPMKRYAEEIKTLAEYGMELLNEALGHVDDSNGESGSVIETLQALHLEACRICKPEPESFGEFLFHKELNDGFDFYYNANERYSEILGSKGIAAFKRAANTVWEALPQAQPRERHKITFSSSDIERSHLRRIVERLHRDDPQALVRILEKDLDDAYDYVELAKRYEAVGKSEQALALAEEGWRIFCKQFSDRSLREYLVEAYHKNGRDADALALLWKEYDRAPSLEGFKQLKASAKRCNQWDAWQEKAIARAAKTIQPKRPGSYYGTDGSLLVAVYLEENETENAWKAAQGHGCSEALWLTLAGLRAKQHPQDAITIYKRIAEEQIRLTEKSAYSRAMELIEKVQKLQDTTSSERTAFTHWTAQLRTQHKAKRNMMKMLDALTPARESA
jgi:uncharacterized Zn finger protein